MLHTRVTAGPPSWSRLVLEPQPRLPKVPPLHKLIWTRLTPASPLRVPAGAARAAEDVGRRASIVVRGRPLGGPSAFAIWTGLTQASPLRLPRGASGGEEP